ncbi:hypothetical protein RclHR1_24840004 [Rhizophagus clarus]|uniref:RNA-directed DNA polymerase from mobile element jockey-like n=1 Tax=Rhizophagus clarus TaxID=94130 RepID=A0A2Z6RT77_9GLOM|nr:hypothetical protein RclHR1_24840004 [Rhizophagus clarus]
MSILNIKRQSISSKKIKLTTHEDPNPFKNSELYVEIYYFIILRRKLKKSSSFQQIKKYWKQVVNHVIHTLNKWDIDNIYYLGKLSKEKEQQIQCMIKRRQQDLLYNQTRSTNNVKSLPLEWLIEYELMESIDPQIYSITLDTITMEELHQAVYDSPKKKACKPTTISYKDLQIFFPALKDQLLSLFNKILTIQQIPKDWLEANIYPIPKPKP